MSKVALKGENCPTSILTQKDVDDIKVSNNSLKELSDYYGVSKSQISRIRNGKQWTSEDPKGVGPKFQNPEDRFWRRVKKHPNGCWNWIGKKLTTGYGVFKLGPKKHRKNIKAHRFSYELHFGPIPGGLLVLHKCDNKLCVNPEHLELGSHSKNLYDAYERGLR